jgi:hypothetical protein
MIDGGMKSRGYCIHCKEDVAEPLPAEVADKPKRTDNQLKCPECGRLSDRIKSYRMGLLIFLLLFWVTYMEREAGCPSCIRKKIASYCAINLVTANLIWPLIILPWSLVLLLDSFCAGHSDAYRR